jgi:protein-S-isoprenylcysteine O-methyltransferase Ste14
MRTTTAPALAATGAVAYATVVERRMEHEYAERDTLTPPTVALLYSAYAATGVAFIAAARRRMWPLPLPRRPARIAGVALAASGGAISALGASRFGSAAQISGIEPGGLATGGLYRVTRNPQYLGLTGLLAGAAIATRSGLAAALTAATWAVFNRWIPNEERHLNRVFGEEYRTYTTRVRRWL